MKYTGSCHCGAIRFEVEATIDKVLSCNCSICQKRGHLLTFVNESAVKPLTGEEALGDYQWGKKRLHFHFCKICGVAPFSRGAKPDGTPTRAINVRCLEGIDLSQIPVQPFDGRSL